MQMIADGIASGRVPAPNFDCAKARTSTEQAICRSYELSALDAEFGDLYQRAHAIDKKGVVLAAANKLYKSGTACNGAEPCIKGNTTAGINFMAKFLRDRGQSVVTSFDQKKILAAQAEDKRRQEEAQREEAKAKAEAERQKQQAAQEAAQKARERLEQDRTIAKQLIDDAAAFLKYSRQNNSPTVLAIAESIASLNAAVSADDAEKLEAATTALSNTIHDDKNYTDFKQRQAEKLAAENARHLADATVLLSEQKCFLLSYIADNPTATASAVFIGETKEIEARLSGPPDLNEIRPLTEKVDGSIAQNGLHDRFVASIAGSCKPAQPEGAQAVEAEKRERLAKDRVAGERLVDDASAFLKYSRELNSPTILSLAEAIASLSGALKGDDPEKVEAAVTTLSSVVESDKSYPPFKRQQEKQVAEENARQLSDAILLLRQQQCFLLSYIADNPTNNASATFVDEAKAADSLLSGAAELKEVRSLSDKIDGSLASSNLRERALAAAASCKASAKPTAQAEADIKLPKTPKNEFLLNGDLTDIVLMFNASQKAPHVAKNLRGDVVFNGGVGVACLYQTTSDDQLLTSARSMLEDQYHVSKPDLDAKPCSRDHLLDYDVIGVRRGDFLLQDREYALSLLKEVEADHFKLLTVLPASAAQSSGVAQLESKILTGSIEGYGFAILTGTASNRVCVTATVSREGHQRVIDSLSDHLSGILGHAPSVVFASLDDAFLQIQRAGCGVVYASASELKDLLAGLKRDSISYRLDENWITQARINQSQQDFVAQVRQQQDQAALDQLREADRRKGADELQKQLREQYGKSAEAAAATLTNDVKTFLESGGKNPSLASTYPGFANWYNSHLADHWELSSSNSELADYGQVNWKERRLESVFGKVSIRLKNATLGEYLDACFLFARIIDNEFSVYRDPIDMECADSTALTSWKSGHSFQSQWIVE
jgi:uncharacterized protein